MGAQQIFSYKPKDGAGGTIQDKILDICISMAAKDYLELPECVSVDVPVQLDSKAVTAYQKLEKDMPLTVDEEQAAAAWQWRSVWRRQEANRNSPVQD